MERDAGSTCPQQLQDNTLTVLKVGQTNCTESPSHSSHWWSSLIVRAFVKDSTFAGEMVCTDGRLSLTFSVSKGG